ncbi:hypothetical protein, partial [Burkholderia ubonensis]|uniref:hypothetical protein n=1 Tax=Burkholderia ubonensis TaxID=101571 RepID=UPI001E515581
DTYRYPEYTQIRRIHGCTSASTHFAHAASRTKKSPAKSENLRGLFRQKWRKRRPANQISSRSNRIQRLLMG